MTGWSRTEKFYFNTAAQAQREAAELRNRLREMIAHHDRALAACRALLEVKNYFDTPELDDLIIPLATAMKLAEVAVGLFEKSEEAE